jgi:hypothetical protein
MSLVFYRQHLSCKDRTVAGEGNAAFHPLYLLSRQTR